MYLLESVCIDFAVAAAAAAVLSLALFANRFLLSNFIYRNRTVSTSFDCATIIAVVFSFSAFNQRLACFDFCLCRIFILVHVVCMAVYIFEPTEKKTAKKNCPHKCTRSLLIAIIYVHIYGRNFCIFRFIRL